MLLNIATFVNVILPISESATLGKSLSALKASTLTNTRHCDPLPRMHRD